MTEEDYVPAKDAADSSSISEDLEADLDRVTQAVSAIQSFENQLSILLQDSVSEEGGAPATRIPELVDEERALLRADLLRRLQNVFSETNHSGQLTSRTYEEAIYLLLMDRITRYVGYYQGLSRASEEMARRNSDLGDPGAMSIDFNGFQRLIMGMDEVHFVRNLGVSLGVDSEDLKKIVNYTIAKEFAPRKSHDDD